MDNKISKTKPADEPTKFDNDSAQVSKRSKSRMRMVSEGSSSDNDEKDKSEAKLVKSAKPSKQERDTKKMEAASKIAEEISRDFSEEDSEIQEFTKNLPSPADSRSKSRIGKAVTNLQSSEKKSINKNDNIDKISSRSKSRAGMILFTY